LGEALTLSKIQEPVGPVLKELRQQPALSSAGSNPEQLNTLRRKATVRRIEAIGPSAICANAGLCDREESGHAFEKIWCRYAFVPKHIVAMLERRKKRPLEPQ